MAKTTSQNSIARATATVPPSHRSAATRRLIVAAPILVAVIFSITYFQLHAPLSAPAANQAPLANSTGSSASETAALQVAPQPAGELVPLPVTVDDRLGPPSPSATGDTNASMAAQPTMTSLQAPAADIPLNPGTLQASKYKQPIEELLPLL